MHQNRDKFLLDIKSLSHKLLGMSLHPQISEILGCCAKVSFLKLDKLYRNSNNYNIKLVSLDSS
jgi:hypothetical protein